MSLKFKYFYFFTWISDTQLTFTFLSIQLSAKLMHVHAKTRFKKTDIQQQKYKQLYKTLNCVCLSRNLHFKQKHM